MELLIDALWPDDPPASARHAVQVYASRLRGGLGDTARIEARSRAYLLRADSDEIDLFVFRSLVADARSALAERRTERCRGHPSRRAGALARPSACRSRRGAERPGPRARARGGAPGGRRAADRLGARGRQGGGARPRARGARRRVPGTGAPPRAGDACPSPRRPARGCGCGVRPRTERAAGGARPRAELAPRRAGGRDLAPRPRAPPGARRDPRAPAPTGATDRPRRPRAGDLGGRRPARRRPTARDPHRSRRDRQDASRAGGGGATRGALRGRRLVRRRLGRVGRVARAVSRRAGARNRRVAGAADRSGGRGVRRRETVATGRRQLRAGRRRRPGAERPPPTRAPGSRWP